MQLVLGDRKVVSHSPNMVTMADVNRMDYDEFIER